MELLEGEPPYMEFPPLRALFLITTKGIPPLKEPGNFPPVLVEFLDTCLEQDAEKRVESTELLKHAFFAQACAPREIGQAVLQVRKIKADSIAAYM